jgi:hypothetical protein
MLAVRVSIMEDSLYNLVKRYIKYFPSKDYPSYFHSSFEF